MYMYAGIIKINTNLISSKIPRHARTRADSGAQNRVAICREGSWNSGDLTTHQSNPYGTRDSNLASSPVLHLSACLNTPHTPSSRLRRKNTRRKTDRSSSTAPSELSVPTDPPRIRRCGGGSGPRSWENRSRETKRRQRSSLRMKAITSGRNQWRSQSSLDANPWWWWWWNQKLWLYRVV